MGHIRRMLKSKNRILNTLLIIKSTKFYIVQNGDVRFSVNICAPVYLYISQMQAYIICKLNPKFRMIQKSIDNLIKHSIFYVYYI